MKLFITGGNGFLGYHVQQAFQKTNFEILAPKSSEVDVLNFDQLNQYVAYNKPDKILAMAAKCGGIEKNLNSPVEFIRDNTQMALNTYEVARIHNIKYVCSLGSVCAYGNLSPIPFEEKNLWEGGMPQKTNNFYSQAKRTLMLLGDAYRLDYGIEGCHLIPVNMFGIKDSFDDQKSHVIPALIK